MLLKINNLKVGYLQNNYILEAVRSVDLGIEKGEFVGLVGESGCGKSTLGFAITSLLPKNGKILGGEVFFEDINLVNQSEKTLQGFRGSEISYIFQDPPASLNPVFTVFDQIIEAVRLHRDLKSGQAEAAVMDLLDKVGLAEIKNRKKLYPHELSGGMQQRAVIAMAIAGEPELLIADEPTTALDATVQVQILRLLVELKERLGLSILLITHDLRLIFKLTHKVFIMYSGRIVEEGKVEQLLHHPAHPYSIGLLNSMPKAECSQFEPIRGFAPDLLNLPEGCKFHPRCKFMIEECKKKEPEMINLGSGHFSRCIRAMEIINERITKSKKP